MSVYSTIRDGIVTDLNGITNIGNVYRRWRLSHDWPTFLKNNQKDIAGQQVIRVWMLRFVGVPETEQEWGAIPEVFGDVYRFLVAGIQAFQDDIDGTSGSEEGFCDLFETVLNTLRGRKDYGIPNNVVEFGVTVVNSVPIEHRDFGGMLCHYTELQVDVKVQQSVTVH